MGAAGGSVGTKVGEAVTRAIADPLPSCGHRRVAHSGERGVAHGAAVRGRLCGCSACCRAAARCRSRGGGVRAADYPTKPSAKPLPELRDLDCGDGREHIGAHRGESIVRLRRAERPIRHLVQRDIQHETRAIVAERHRVVIVSWVIHQAQLPLGSELVRRSIGLDRFGEHVLTRHRRRGQPHLTLTRRATASSSRPAPASSVSLLRLRCSEEMAFVASVGSRRKISTGAPPKLRPRGREEAPADPAKAAGFGGGSGGAGEQE